MLEVSGSVSTVNAPAALGATGTGLIDIDAGGLFRATTLNSATTITNDGAISTTAGGAINGLTGTGNITVSGGTVASANGITQSSLTLSGGAIMDIATNGAASGVTKIKAINIATSGPGYVGKLELRNNDLIVDYTASTNPYATVLAMVKAGLTSLGGNGTGIGSSTVDSGPAGTRLGVVDNGAISGSIPNLSGAPAPAQSVLVKYTWLGDANLDGVVDGTDYALTDTGFGSGGNRWNIGDYNYSGTVDGTDYSLIDTGFGSQSGALPEPACVGILGVLGCGLLRRSRRRHRRA